MIPRPPTSTLFPYTTLFRSQPRARRAGWFFDALAHIETGLLIGIPLAPVAATFATVVMYIDPVEPSFWRLVSASRSEEHTSELQSRFDLVCRLLLEKKKKNH